MTPGEILLGLERENQRLRAELAEARAEVERLRGALTSVCAFVGRLRGGDRPAPGEVYAHWAVARRALDPHTTGEEESK